MKSVIISTFLVFLAFVSMSQKPDTLFIKLNDFGKLCIFSNDLIKEKNNSFSIDSIYKKLSAELKNQKLTDFENPVLINCTVIDNEISDIKISKNEIIEKEVFIKENKSFSFDNYKIEIRINDIYKSKNKITIFLTDEKYIQSVIDFNLDSIYKQVITDIEKDDISKQEPYKLIYETQDNKINTENNYLKYTSKNNHLIEYYPIFGVLLINSTLIPELGAALDFSFIKKGIFKQSIGLSMNILYYPGKDNFFEPDEYGFINLSYGLSVTSTSSKILGMKINLGYNLYRKGSLYDKNTYKWSLDINSGSFITSIGVISQITGEMNFWKPQSIPVIGLKFAF